MVVGLDDVYFLFQHSLSQLMAEASFFPYCWLVNKPVTLRISASLPYAGSTG